MFLCLLRERYAQHLRRKSSLPKAQPGGGAEGAQAPPLAIRILMFIS